MHSLDNRKKGIHQCVITIPDNHNCKLQFYNFFHLFQPVSGTDITTDRVFRLKVSFLCHSQLTNSIEIVKVMRESFFLENIIFSFLIIIFDGFSFNYFLVVLLFWEKIQLGSV